MKKKLRILLVAVPVLLLVAVLAIAGLTMGSGPRTNTGSAGSSSSAGKPTTGELDTAGVGGVAAAPSGAVGKQAAAIEPMTRAVISTGQLTLHPTSMSRARSEVMRLVTSWGGSVADEQTSSDDRGRLVDSTMTLRVPTSKFSEAMTAFAGLGKVEQQSRKSEDVTTQVIDNDARVRAAERSIQQIETLLSRAKDLSDIIAIESDLARRQADLDSLKSQQAWLDDQTSLSTISVYLSQTTHPRHDQRHTKGFLTGLDNGWTAMKGATVVLLTVVGAVLPFALVLVLVGVPLWLVVRRRLGASVSAGSAPAQSA
jgi:hypothetical protein